ncbi:aminopeptidase [Pseudodesulfovibrio sp. S3]|uniref:aminopeptidase n=1 Tax=unclassified Pseudodesulfovibrio TaxID=2661612 RepID=UPI000FEBC894|nr:aminopeptidase [Pseudodesulfovibrio sp. S3]MCJ2162977.1 aminopeptidase [Pseudodesulfovibrio sp. S3-i]RWU06975.1 aminopeptidase [Pseudodesulfovibrio sp. S3]
MSLYDQVDLENYAEVMVWAMNQTRERPLRNSEVVLIRYDIPGLPLAEAVYSRLMDLHLMPVPAAMPTPYMEMERYLNSSYGQLLFQQPGLSELYSQAAGVINIIAPESLTHLQTVDPRTIAEARRADAPNRRILQRRMQSGSMGWTTCLYPTSALAEASGMTLEEYAHALKRACWLNMPNPVREWQRLQREVRELCAWLDSMEIRSLKVESEDINLKVGVGDNRRFVGVNGANIPGYEVYFAPDARKVDGTYYMDQPTLRYGHLVTGMSLDFSDGIATQVEAERGQVFLQNQMYSDAGARRVGEFSLTDKRFSRVDRFMAHTLLDENHGGEHGNCHLALGGSVLESFTGPPEMLTPELEYELGFNSSDMHWDLVNTQPKRVTAWLKTGSPRLIYENGVFKI